MTDREIQESIEKYIKGTLTDSQVDALWVEFIAYPEWYTYFDIYLHLIALSKNIMDERDDIDINDIEGEGEWWEFTDEFIAVPIDKDDDEEEQQLKAYQIGGALHMIAAAEVEPKHTG